MKPILQVALDFVDLNRTLKLAKESISGGADWLEVGTPLIKSLGVDIIRELRRQFPNITIVADMKTMDVGRTEVELAAKAGANIVSISGCADNQTIKESINAGINYGAEIVVDMLAVDNVLARVKIVDSFGANYVSIHIPIDSQMTGKISFDLIKEVRKVTNLPIAIAGGINSENVVSAIKAGANIIIVGGAITKSSDAKAATQKIKYAMIKKIAVATDLYTRVTEPDVKKVLLTVSTANISDAMYRAKCIPNLTPVYPGIKFAGPVITVKTAPGDWAKPVEAIDIAKPGDVLFIDAYGSGPAVWGELATHSAKNKKLAGVIVHGAVRDSCEIRKLKFPIFSKLVISNAGEPKGYGEIKVPLNIEGITINPGDWAVADDDGVIIIPIKILVEVTNRAMDVLEKENRIRSEIDEGSTLSKVTELLKWEKK